MNRRTFRFITGFCLTIALLGLQPIARYWQDAIAQTSGNNALYYTVLDRKIPLTVREDAIAVSFKSSPLPGSPPRTRGEVQFSPLPLYLQLQEDLQREGERETGSLTRGGASRSSRGTEDSAPPEAPPPRESTRFAVQVSPLNEEYAIANLVSGTATDLQTRIETQPYVETTFPVLQRADVGTATGGSIVLPNEIILSFEPNTSDEERQTILTANGLEMIRPLRFTENRYVVRSREAVGLEVLRAIEQLNAIASIRSATPNFIQTISDRTLSSASEQTLPFSPPDAPLLSMQWHLNSIPLSSCLDRHLPNLVSSGEDLGQCLQNATPQPNNQRTDIRATEAWQQSQQGEGIVVAVIDSWIQWDRPDLEPNLYSTADTPGKLPGEIHGWDFVENDSDTRISPAEFNLIGGKFEDAFLLTDEELRQQYPETFNRIQTRRVESSPTEVAQKVRSVLANEVAGDFHGTMVAGVIAARSPQELGATGVAPRAKILPARVMGLNDSFSLSGYLEAIAYAAARGADIINISLGSPLPAQGEVELITEVLQNNPKLIVVASAGNENRGELSFPAAIPGVVAVGATNIYGDRAPYSNFGSTTTNGQGLTLVAPGGDNSIPRPLGWILTTGGTGSDLFWQGIPTSRLQPDWGPNWDERGRYRWTTGTSFAAPAVTGVVALMKGEDGARRLARDRLVAILKETASYEGLRFSSEERERYQTNASSSRVSANQYFFGSGLVNAEAAVQAVKRSL
ncbi:MAG: S8 family serine peptidase [Cyanobacteriota bacterium]|nr:S8 family serine peptidase [Cyanobacteriota bacterium]